MEFEVKPKYLAPGRYVKFKHNITNMDCIVCYHENIQRLEGSIFKIKVHKYGSPHFTIYNPPDSIDPNYEFCFLQLEAIYDINPEEDPEQNNILTDEWNALMGAE